MKVKIGSKLVGEGEHCFILAEAGINHNGDIKVAKKLIDKAKEAGADAIKFQSYHTEDFVSKKSEYYQLFKDLELSDEEFKELCEFAKEKNIIFISTPLDLKYVDILNEMNVPAFKIASGDLTFTPLLKKVAKTKKAIIVSTGMATIGEIDEAINTIKKAGNEDIILLHCISSYPAPFEEVNLKAIITLKNTFNLTVGYSDHTIGAEVPLAAVALGAKVIEKHFTLNKDMEGPDHRLSADPEEFKEMVEGIRIIEKALGDGNKRPMECEKDERISGRRSIVAKMPIKEEEKITEENILYKRPAIGIEPKFSDIVFNKKVKRDIGEGDIIKWENLMKE